MWSYCDVKLCLRSSLISGRRAAGGQSECPRRGSDPQGAVILPIGHESSMVHQGSIRQTIPLLAKYVARIDCNPITTFPVYPHGEGSSIRRKPKTRCRVVKLLLDVQYLRGRAIDPDYAPGIIIAPVKEWSINAETIQRYVLFW